MIVCDQAGDEPLGDVVDGEEAAGGFAAPSHFEMFTFNTASPEAFAAACGRLGVTAAVPRAGQRLTREPPHAH